MVSNAFEFSIVSLDEAREILDDGALQKARPERVVAGDPRWMRRASRPEDRSLASETKAWLQSLPAPVRPGQCAMHYPRIANNLAVLAGKPDEIKSYLQELIRGEREGRQGFPYGIPAELIALRAHVDSQISEGTLRWY